MKITYSHSTGITDPDEIHPRFNCDVCHEEYTDMIYRVENSPSPRYPGLWFICDKCLLNYDKIYVALSLRQL